MINMHVLKQSNIFNDLIVTNIQVFFQNYKSCIKINVPIVTKLYAKTYIHI